MGDAGHTEGTCKFAVPVDVDLVNGHDIVVFFADFFENRKKFFTGRTPVGIEIENQETVFGCFQDVIKLFQTFYAPDNRIFGRSLGLVAGIVSARYHNPKEKYRNNGYKKAHPTGVVFYIFCHVKTSVRTKRLI